ncbi:HET-domain-containing protein [Colletotrichum asianum]
MSETSMPNRLSLKNAQAPGDTARLEHYSPLGADQVRLIQLHSYNDKLGMVECTMTCENLGRSEFLALSYTWDDSTDIRMIVVNDKQFEVTANLEGFLRTFANGYFEATHSKLWIDAICIDQSDISERISQVLRMSSIYSSAQEVLVWLGEHTQEAAAGYSEIIRFCDRLAEQHDPFADVYELTHESTRTALLRTIFATSLRGEDSSVDDIFDRATNANITGAVGQDLIANTSGSTISRRIAITSSGMITLVPVMTDPGDSVVFLVGGSVFYVLRRLADVQDTDDDSVSTKTFRFIGEAC